VFVNIFRKLFLIPEKKTSLDSEVYRRSVKSSAELRCITDILKKIFNIKIINPGGIIDPARTNYSKN